MASGLLGRRNGDDTNGTVYTVPATTLAVVNLSIANTTSSADDVVVYVVPSGGSASTEHTIESFSLGANNTLERTNIVMASGDFLVVNATAGTVANAWGVEESTA
tara:strand:+ start:2788 stop:3102 length:315 start_codon:yes stop_codon:yes gene_type:complete